MAKTTNKPKKPAAKSSKQHTNTTKKPDKADIERERLSSLINSMADGVIAIDSDGKVVITNGAALDILDSNVSISGKSIYRILHLVDQSRQKVDLRKVIKNIKGTHSTRDWLIQYSDGSEVNLYLSIAQVRLGYGKDTEHMHGYVLLLRDITREKSLEEERDEFISVVSHELRTPIAISEGNISNAVFLFKRSGINDPVVENALEQAHEQITFLSGMMNDLATLSRAERGKLNVEVEAINAHELVNQLVSTYQNDAKDKGIELKCELDPHLELLHSSKLYVKEVLQNFITNSIKYTEEGSVTIGAKSRENGVEFFVRDTGIGIGKSDREKVFDKFFRSEDYRTRQNSGTGLGLYVTMKLAKLLHAEIDLESQLNHGSTFTVYVPNLEPAGAPDKTA
jgi:two-component system, OmpR family, phosphate regulon sensor histidine kinase PhoR